MSNMRRRRRSVRERRRLYCLPNFNLYMGPSMGLNLIKIDSPNIYGPTLFPELILMVYQKQNIQTIPNFQSLACAENKSNRAEQSRGLGSFKNYWV